MATPDQRDNAYFALVKECTRCGIPCICHLRRAAPSLVTPDLQLELRTAHAMADRCGRRQDETLPEFIRRLYDETLNDAE